MDGQLQTDALVPSAYEQMLGGLAKQLHSSAFCADQDLGHMEEHLLRGGQELFR